MKRLCLLGRVSVLPVVVEAPSTIFSCVERGAVIASGINLPHTVT